MKRLFRICLGILGLYLLACAAIGITVAEMALHPHRRTLTPADEAKAPLWAQDDGAILTTVEIRSLDGIPLRA